MGGGYIHRPPYESKLNPFPLVETDAMLSGDGGVRSANASVTITTAFNALAHAGQDCFLNITHVLRPGAGRGRSRVRIDSLTVSAGNLMGAFGYMYARGRGHGGKSGKRGQERSISPSLLAKQAATCSPTIQYHCRNSTGKVTFDNGGGAGWAYAFSQRLCTDLWKTKVLSAEHSALTTESTPNA